MYLCDYSRKDSKESSESRAGAELHGPGKKKEERTTPKISKCMLLFQGT